VTCSNQPPHNKQMQRTRHGQNGASPLICVLFRRPLNRDRGMARAVPLLLVLTLATAGCDGMTTAGGRVLDKDRKPVAGAHVTFTRASDGYADDVVTGPDGAFRVAMIHGPLLCGTLRLQVTAEGFGHHEEAVPCKTHRDGDVVLAVNGAAHAPK
jgi:hypothetical protein